MAFRMLAQSSFMARDSDLSNIRDADCQGAFLTRDRSAVRRRRGSSDILDDSTIR